MLPKTIEEHKRRALRLFLGVSFPCLIGFGVLGPEYTQYSRYIDDLCKWAAITASIVAQPLIGKANQVGGERVLGTILGGICGYLVHVCGSFFDQVGFVELYALTRLLVLGVGQLHG
jgi:uncharacterized membrane protein YccC